jgi:methylenetetrahydrofolate reductase (NADPH)
MQIPESLAAEIEAADERHVADIGVEWAVRQSVELLEAGIPYLHFYVIQTPEHAVRVVDGLRKLA